MRQTTPAASGRRWSTSCGASSRCAHLCSRSRLPHTPLARHRPGTCRQQRRPLKSTRAIRCCHKTAGRWLSGSCRRCLALLRQSAPLPVGTWSTSAASPLTQHCRVLEDITAAGLAQGVEAGCRMAALQCQTRCSLVQFPHGVSQLSTSTLRSLFSMGPSQSNGCQTAHLFYTALFPHARSTVA